MSLIGLNGLPISEDNLIAKPKVIPVSIIRLATKDGMGQAAGHIRIGDPFLVDLTSVASSEFITKEGKRFKAETIHIVDSVGRDLGWMYVELFFI